MCPFESPGTKRGSVKDSYIALILMAPNTNPLPRQSSGDSETHSDTNSPDTEAETESIGAVILNNNNESSVDDRIEEILGRALISLHLHYCSTNYN